jgi:hypothetical protein
MYEELKLDQILITISALQRRITERFPESSLSRIAAELHRIGEDLAPALEKLRRPRWGLRALLAAAILALAGLLALFTLRFSRVSVAVSDIGALLQAVEAATQDLIFLFLATYFVLTLETRLRRRAALRALHRLRVIVHIVDMHQLTKDPEHLYPEEMRTPSSPTRGLSRFELSRYLDYCTELLALASKLAALHVQHLNDPVVLDAVTDIETLAGNLSSKIWQKIVILDTAPLARRELPAGTMGA